jgi:lipopolysaccharide biosynthesis protein
MVTAMKNLKLVAFYLPQFHRIPENDRWWGDGFTEWTNVTKAKPYFPGHHQPHAPLNDNYYDLSDPGVMVEQAKMAQKYGISGFCFYHYWFNGHKLLETPVEMMLKSKKPDFPFMLCWANENWTRRWDGEDAEVLIAQSYETHDFDAHAKYLAPYMQDKRYINIDGKPVLAIYRADYLPQKQSFIQNIRESLERAGVSDVVLLAMSRNADIDASLLNLGIDRIIDFRPDQKNAEGTSLLSKLLRVIPQYLKRERRVIIKAIFPKLIYSFYFNYKNYAINNMNALLRENHYPCVVPTWDNSARRKHLATIIQNNDPNMYGIWLEKAIQSVLNRSGDQIVFINAWNEWAEGCHLEPDEYHGDAFLQATLKAAQNARG